MAMDLSSVFGMSIGKDTSNKFKLSLNGLAVQVSDNSYVTYDHKKDELSQAIIFDFGGAANSVFRVPVPLPDVKKGDIILASDNPLTVYFVVDDPQKGTKELKVVTPTGNRTTFSPTNNPFATGAAFVVVVTSLFGRAGGDFSLEKLLPLLVLSDTKGTAGGGGDDL